MVYFITFQKVWNQFIPLIINNFTILPSKFEILCGSKFEKNLIIKKFIINFLCLKGNNIQKLSHMEPKTFNCNPNSGRGGRCGRYGRCGWGGRGGGVGGKADGGGGRGGGSGGDVRAGGRDLSLTSSVSVHSRVEDGDCYPSHEQTHYGQSHKDQQLHLLPTRPLCWSESLVIFIEKLLFYCEILLRNYA